MGLLGELLLLPLAPVRTVAWVTETVVDAAEREQVAQLRRELAALETELVSGRISEEEFDRREDEILDLLEEFDRGVAG